jgi:kynurenine formamidase
VRTIVELSVPLQAGIASDPPGHVPEIDYYDHRQTAAEVVSFFPGATIDDLPDGEGWAIERVRITTHNGTHVDAPYHYSSTIRWAAESAPSRSTKCRWTGAYNPR